MKVIDMLLNVSRPCSITAALFYARPLNLAVMSGLHSGDFNQKKEILHASEASNTTNNKGNDLSRSEAAASFAHFWQCARAGSL